jgi:hypothetical protein
MDITSPTVAAPVSDLLPENRKQTLWDKIKRRNVSSPTFHHSLRSNLSTRSLPRLSPERSHSAISPVWTKITLSAEHLDEYVVALPCEDSTEPSLGNDCFSALPDEIKLHILSYLTNRQVLGTSRVRPQISN